MQRRSLMWTPPRNTAVFSEVVWGKMENCSVVFVNHGHCVRQTENEMDHPAWQLDSSTAYLFNFHFWKDTINVEEHIEVLEQHLLPSRQLSGKSLHVSAKQCLNHILDPSQQHDLAGEESRYWTDLPAVQIFHQQNIWCINEKPGKEGPGLLSS